MFQFSEQLIAALMRSIYEGSITEDELPKNLYFAIAEALKKAVYEGYGGTIADFEAGSSDLLLLTELRENIYMFSAAKTYQQVRDMTDAIVKEDGTLRNFKEFREEADQIFTQYNDNWLQTEYETAIGQAQSAEKWNDIEEKKKVLPFLKYSAVEDDNTSDICEPLDGVCLPVDDPFWDEFMPLNHFRCRCAVEQLSEEDAEVTSQGEIDKLKADVGAEMQAIFKMNPGKDKVIFKDDHPYFDVAKRDQALAENNFNLPIPGNDE